MSEAVTPGDLRERGGLKWTRYGEEGGPFGVGGKGHARLNFATPGPILTEIVERIGSAL